MITKKTKGTYSASDLAQQIHDFELFGLVFVGCTIKGDWNHLHFADSHLPTPIHVVPANSEAPSGATLIWSGQMLVDGSSIDVNVFRDAASGVVAALGLTGETNPMMGLRLVEQDATPTMSRDVVVERALSGVGTSTAYTLVNPRSPPLALERWPSMGISTDCSGYVAWCLRMSRKVQHPLYKKVNSGWFETTAIYKDGQTETGFFSPAAKVMPGCLVVYPDKGGTQGHIGIVVSGEGAGLDGIAEVVHCSSGNYKKSGKAIMRTDARVWQKRADSLVLDYIGYS